jgi:predicted CopG family antitoxin
MGNIKNSSHNRHTVMVDERVYSRLRCRGVFGESFSSIIARILDEVEQNEEVGASKN